MSKFKTRVRKGKVIDGIINIDKPLGFSSNKALQKVKYLLQAQKAGHTGALDPLASGVLPLCFGQATKISSYLLDSDKRYQATLQLGEVSSTGDKEGEIIQRNEVPQFESDTLKNVIASFLGEQTQIPPMHSAVKHQGQPLYKLARKGKEIERKGRLINIYEIQVLDCNDNLLTIDVKCSKGTYIRTLAEDIGQKLGCGAHLAALRRTEAGPFSLENAHTIEEVTEYIQANRLQEILLDSDMALQNYPSVVLQEEQTADIKFGRKIALSAEQILPIDQSVPEQKYRIYDPEQQFLGLGELSISSEDEQPVYLLPKRMFL